MIIPWCPRGTQSRYIVLSCSSHGPENGHFVQRSFSCRYNSANYSMHVVEYDISSGDDLGYCRSSDISRSKRVFDSLCKMNDVWFSSVDYDL